MLASISGADESSTIAADSDTDTGIFAAAIGAYVKSEQLNIAAMDPDPNYTQPINDTPIDIPQLDQLPDSPLKQFALQTLFSAADIRLMQMHMPNTKVR